VTGIVVTSVGEEIIIRHPLEQTNPAWVGAILTGSTLFLTGRAWLDYTTFSRIAWSRVSGLLVLAAMAPVMLLLSPIMVAVVANIVLLGIATSDTIAWRIFPRAPAPPSG
jgi:low temperature requirement protein LtrA